MAESNHRDRTIDAVSGMMILFMVVFHIAGQYERTDLFSTISFRPLMFFMFWFFFKGGMVEKDRELANVIIIGAKRLILPALLWLLIGILIYESVNLLLMRPTGLSITILSVFLNEGSVYYHLPVWFLLSLFFVRCLYSLIRACCMRLKLLICCICIIGAAFFNSIETELPLYVTNTLLGLAFYLLGNRLKCFNYGWMTILPASVIYLLILTVCPSSIDFRTNRLIEGNYPCALLSAFTGCILFQGIFKNFDLRLLQYIGRNSMIWLLVHWPVKYLGGILIGQIPEMSFLAKTIILLVITMITVEGCIWTAPRIGLAVIFGGKVSTMVDGNWRQNALKTTSLLS